MGSVETGLLRRRERVMSHRLREAQQLGPAAAAAERERLGRELLDAAIRGLVRGAVGRDATDGEVGVVRRWLDGLAAEHRAAALAAEKEGSS